MKNADFSENSFLKNIKMDILFMSKFKKITKHIFTIFCTFFMLIIKIEMLYFYYTIIHIILMTDTINFVTWCSIDPVRCKVDVYPKSISIRIEKSYNQRNRDSPTQCVLGKDFFNATVHFHPSGSLYQTTPGMYMGRSVFKQPGYRSVKRICVNNPQDIISIYSKQVNSEWRVAHSSIDSEICFTEKISRDLWIETSEDLTDEILITNWKPEDLDSGPLDKNIIVWQWCRGVTEHQGDINRLSDNWWMPYNYENSVSIERTFNNGVYNVNHVDIDLPVIGTRTIEFDGNSCYARQVSLDRTRVRTVRRVVKTLQELKMMFDRISMPIIDINTILSGLPDGTIPHHFNCPILQDIMQNPVKTIDNHVYDKYAIERWFIDHNTSPLTGLSLVSKVLTPHYELKKEIDEFLERLANKQSASATSNQVISENNQVDEEHSDDASNSDSDSLDSIN